MTDDHDESPAAGTADPGESAGSGGVMGGAAQAAFAAEIERLRSTSAGGPLDRAVAGLGIGAVALGLVTCLVAYSQATGFSDVRDQMESLILAVFGVGLVVFGSVLYLRNSVTRFLRFWLLRVIYEQRDLAAHPAGQDERAGQDGQDGQDGRGPRQAPAGSATAPGITPPSGSGRRPVSPG